jgi:hypothetical protein
LSSSSPSSHLQYSWVSPLMIASRSTLPVHAGLKYLYC